MPETRIPMVAIRAAEAAVREGVRIRLGENALALAAAGQPLMLSGTEAELAVCLAMAALAKHGLIAGTPAPAGEGSGVTAPPRPPASTHSPETSGAGGNGQPEPSEALSALRGEPVDLDAARQRINRAHTELGEVCAQGPSRRFKMHIPADPERDTDLIISAALNDADLLTGEVDQLRETLARALRIADYHADLHRQAVERADRMAEMVIEKDREATQWADWLHQAEATIARVRSHCQQVTTQPAWEDYEIGRHDHARQVLDLLDGTDTEEQTGAATTEETNDAR